MLETTRTSALQSRMHKVARTSGARWVALPGAAPGHMAWSVRMPNRLGNLACTCAMLLLLSTKPASTTSAKFKR